MAEQFLDPPRSVATGAQASAEQSTQADLIRRLKAGEDAAYEELVRDQAGRLLAVARRIARTEADAEDIVQEAFLSAFKSIEKFDGRSNLGTWLHRITVNAALMKARKAGTRRESSIDALLPRFEGGMHAQRPAQWRDVAPDSDDRLEQRNALWNALDQLPDEFRSVIVLKDVEGLPSAAIAASLDISDALVRQRLHRGRQALVKLLESAMQESRR